MKLNQEYASRFDIQSMAGFGPIAWNQGGDSVKRSTVRRHRDPRVVKIDHEARQREDNPKREALYVIQKHSFNEPESVEWRFLKTSAVLILAGLFLLAGGV